ncbi:MAG: glycoside hydrolase family 15 protein, partial [Phycisphaerales bacterium]
GGGPDAATLWTGLSSMLEPDDGRFIATVDAVERHLRNGPTVYRYFHDDGLPGSEGGFNLCTAWLIESLSLIGRQQEAEDLFRSYLQLAGATGLMSEEYDPVGKKALGNVPQAYSHLGLINAALRLAETD